MTTHPDLVALASAANEEAIAFRTRAPRSAQRAAQLLAAVDALTGAIVEEANR